MGRQGLASGRRGREWAQLLLRKAFCTHSYSFRAKVQFYPLHLLIRESLPGSENIAKYVPLPRTATGCHCAVTVPEGGVQLSPLGSPCCSAAWGPCCESEKRSSGGGRTLLSLAGLWTKASLGPAAWNLASHLICQHFSALPRVKRKR